MRGRWLAAVLASGPGALLSHRSAAALWGLARVGGGRIDVTALRGKRGRPGIALRQVRQLHAEDRGELDGIPVTAVPRTLLDLAADGHSRIRKLGEEAERLRLLDMREVERLLANKSGAPGIRALRGALDSLDEAPPTRSALECCFLDICADGGLPAPDVNVVVAGIEVDALWAPASVVVELDGFRFHRTRAAFERDRERDAILLSAGYRVLRLTWRRLHRGRAEVIATLRSLLESSPTRGT